MPTANLCLGTFLTLQTPAFRQTVYMYDKIVIIHDDARNNVP